MIQYILANIIDTHQMIANSTLVAFHSCSEDTSTANEDVVQ